MEKMTTKDKILIAARRLFAEHGFAGASIGKIAKLAGVNHSLVFHHFKNKEQLWVAVKLSIVQESNQQVQTLPNIRLPFAEFLKELFVRNMHFYRDHPDMIRMLNWQRLENSGQKIGVTHSEEMQRWINAFQHYQQCGDIQNKYKPEFIVTMILSIISSAALDPNIFIHNKKNQEDYINFSIECLIKSLK